MDIIIFILGLIVGGLISWLIASIYNRKAGDEQTNKIQNLEISVSRRIDNAVSAMADRFQVETNINNTHMQDGGRVAVEIYWKDGPIIDIGNPQELSKNRLLLSTKRPSEILLDLFDSNGRHYHLQSEFQSFDTMAFR